MKRSNKRAESIILLLSFILLISACSGDDDVVPIIPSVTVAIDKQIVEPCDDISFTSTSTEASSIRWDFGDGNFSEEENPTHTYSDFGEYDVVATVTSSTGDVSNANITAAVGERVFAGFVVNSISETDANGNAWDADGTGPEIFFGATAQSSQEGITLYPIGTDVTNADIQATDLRGIGGLLPENDRVRFTNEPWDFLLIDDDDPLGAFDAEEIMYVFTINPVTIDREELSFETGQGVILVEESGFTIRLLCILQTP